MIAIESVSKVFEGKNGRQPVCALDGVTVNVTAGEFVTVIGPSGSGKSTLLFTMGAMMQPTSGEVKVDDTEIYNLPVSGRTKLRQSYFGFVFQTFNLLPYLKCRENVALPAILAGVPQAEARAKAESLLERLGLEDRLFHRPVELSVGERQRIALCRSLINNPEVLLADEPTGNLDPTMADQAMDLLLEFNEAGQTIVLVTHNHSLAERGTRVLDLRGGAIVEDRLARGRSQAS